MTTDSKTEEGASPYAVELVPPDITPYRDGNTGVEYVTTFDSGIPGPHVMVNAVTHGNEICGAIALDRLFKMKARPRRGKLSLSFANVAAYHCWDASHPHANRYVDED
ncbi:MAG: succinylglutamate desuccinylase, partial [Pseudomonadota bacterium]